MKKTIFFILYILLLYTSVEFFTFEKSFCATQKTKSELLSDYNNVSPEIVDFDFKKSFIKMVISLLIVIVMIFGFFFLLQKIFNKTTSFSNNSKGMLKIIEKHPLGPKNYLLLIWAIDRMILCSYDNGKIEKITEFPSNSVPREISEDVFDETLMREQISTTEEEVANG